MIHGVDISHHNGAINFDKLLSTGKAGFVGIRVCHGQTMDTKFYQNLAQVKAKKIPYFFYWYSEASSIADGQAEARFVLSKISGTSPLFVAFDAEYSALQAQTKSITTDIIDKSLYIIKQAGYVPYFYTNKNWMINEVDVQFLKNKGYGFWYAFYSGQNPDNANYSAMCDMWQYSDQINLPGNGSSAIDLNVCYNADLIRKITGGNVNSDFCDTTHPFSKDIGDTYQFKTGSPIKSGNENIFRFVSQTQSGGYYFTKFKAVGKGSAGFYLGDKRIVIGTVE